MSRWVAEEAILEKIKQFIELGRPTSLEISPQVAMFYLLYEDPSSPSETIASKLIAAFENNPSSATRQLFLKRVKYIRKFEQVPSWFHEYLMTQSGRKPWEWRGQFQQFILSRSDFTFLSVTGQSVWNDLPAIQVHVD